MFNSFWRNRICKRRNRSKPSKANCLSDCLLYCFSYIFGPPTVKETGLKWILLWGRISLSIIVQTTINHCRFVHLFACLLFLFCFVLFCLFFNHNIDVKWNDSFSALPRSWHARSVVCPLDDNGKLATLMPVVVRIVCMVW